MGRVAGSTILSLDMSEGEHGPPPIRVKQAMHLPLIPQVHYTRQGNFRGLKQVLTFSRGGSSSLSSTVTP